MEVINQQPLLSICIPTYNRAKYLEKTLPEIIRQVEEINRKDQLEVLVSDNCSCDNTSDIVCELEQLYPITYIKNPINIGPDGNFINCFNKARGKYVWLLGDDDLILKDSIKEIMKIISEEDYGLVHIDCENSDGKNEAIDDINFFLSNVSYWITFISANIFRSDIVKKIKVTEELKRSFMLQVPYFLTSATSYKKNYLLRRPILGESLANKSNGGYNLFKVFVQNHLGFWKKMVDDHKISMECYEYVKKDTYLHFLRGYVYQLLLLRQNLKKNNIRKGKKGGFYIDHGWEILYKTYSKNLYFWISFVKFPLYYLNWQRKRLAKLLHQSI